MAVQFCGKPTGLEIEFCQIVSRVNLLAHVELKDFKDFNRQRTVVVENAEKRLKFMHYEIQFRALFSWGMKNA